MPGGPKKTSAPDPGALFELIDRQITTAERDIDERERYVKGLKSAREIVAREVLTHALNGNGKRNGRRHRRSSTFNGSGSRSAMLRTILANVSEPVTVDEILGEMRKHNVEDDKTNLRSTLSALKRAGEVKNPERGRWIAASQKTARQTTKAA